MIDRGARNQAALLALCLFLVVLVGMQVLFWNIERVDRLTERVEKLEQER